MSFSAGSKGLREILNSHVALNLHNSAKSSFDHQLTMVSQVAFISELLPVTPLSSSFLPTLF